MDDSPDDGLRLLTVHAHPDDEASKGAATVHRYAREGVRCVLVTATGGEEGDILNPAMDRPEVRERLHLVRLEELARAAAIIGYHEVVMLGYRDSGMAGTEANSRPGCFAAADLGEAVGRLVAVIRRERPHVIVTYADDQEGYPHPDHLRVHDISVVAFDAAADPDRYPEAGPPWQVSKLYYSAWAKARIVAMHEKFLELGLDSPFPEEWRDRPGLDHRLTTRIDVLPEDDVSRPRPAGPRHPGRPRLAVLVRAPARGGQRLSVRRLHPGPVGGRTPTPGAPVPGAPVPEDDLFAGLREPVRR